MGTPYGRSIVSVLTPSVVHKLMPELAGILLSPEEFDANASLSPLRAQRPGYAIITAPPSTL